MAVRGSARHFPAWHHSFRARRNWGWAAPSPIPLRPLHVAIVTGLCVGPVSTTDRFFDVAASDHFAEIVRTRIAPLVLPQIVKFEAAREYLFRTVSQITINYRGKGLDAGHAGPLHGGDRFPWVRIGDGDNYEPLTASEHVPTAETSLNSRDLTRLAPDTPARGREGSGFNASSVAMPSSPRA